MRHIAKSEKTVAEETPTQEAELNVAEESPAAEKTAPKETDRLPESTRTRRGAHARGRQSPISKSTIWKAVFAITLLALLATAVTLILLQSAGIINWGFLGPTG